MVGHMRAVQVARAGGGFESVERAIPEPGPGAVRVRVQACGICHSDSLTHDGHWPGITFPRVPGHEVAGVVDAVGAGVTQWKPGARVGLGWHGGHCGHCNSCLRGDFVTCERDKQITGITMDGGYADFVIAPAPALAAIPDGLSAVEAAPLMCAGVTTFNALRNAGLRPGATVAVLGLGGLGHLGVQFAAKMGFRTVAIARGADKAALARELGASLYLDSEASNPGEQLAKLGGANAILATVTNAPAMTAVLGGLAVGGKLIIVGAPAEPLQISALWLISGRRSVVGWPSGAPIDSADALAFSALTGVRSRNEVFPVARVSEAYARMMSGHARFRVVLAMSDGG